MTKVLIPPQTSTATSWEVTDYGAIHSSDLTLLGLIHTHPGFEAFMSSVDLHALYDISRLSPLSKNTAEISIVLAPEHGNSPIFKLSNFGKEVLSNCDNNSHHVHMRSGQDVSRLMYSIANHAVMDDLYIDEFSIIDLR